MANLRLNMSGVYERETFDRGGDFITLDCRDLAGTYGYCDDAAASILRARLADVSPTGLHFLDGGNYHYLSLFFIEKIAEPFELVLFDHHSDAGDSAFGLLSCGCWVRAAMACCDHLRRVIAVGPDETQQALVDAESRRRMAFVCETDALASVMQGDLPVYISLDKDVLSPEELTTDWDQGAMTVRQLEEDLAWLFANRRVIGMDVCGEAPVAAPESAVVKNDAFNQRMCEIWQENQ